MAAVIIKTDQPLTTGLILIFVLLGAVGKSVAQTGEIAKRPPKLKCSSSHAQLKSTETVERELGGGECHLYEITLSVDHFLQVNVEQRGVDVVVALYDHNGVELSKVDRPNGSRGPETFSFIATIDGVYFLSIQSFDRVSARGKYDLTLRPTRLATAADAMQVKAERLISEGEQLRGKAHLIRAAIPKFQQAAELWRALGNEYEEAVACYAAGLSFSATGDNQAAIDFLKRALHTFIRLENSSGTAMVNTGLGWSYLYLADLEKAYESFSEAFEIHRTEQNVRGEGITLYGLGWVHAVRAEDQEALQKFSESLACRRKAMDLRGESLTLTGIGKMESRLGQPAKALTSLRAALDRLPEGEEYARADILSNLGWVHRALNEPEKAMGFFTSALAIRQKLGDSIGEATTRYGMSAVHYKSGRFREAESEIEAALKIVESLRASGSNRQLRISYFSSVQEYYEFYITFLLELDQRYPSAGYAGKALHVAERARARGLLDLLSEAKVDLRENVDPTLVNRKSYEALIQPQPLTALEIQNQVLDHDTLLLHYVPSDQGSFVLAVTTDQITSHKLASRSEIESVARQFYEAATARNRFDSRITSEEMRARVLQADRKANEVAGDLSRMLLLPVSSRLTKRRLLVVATGALQLIPFAALPLPVSNSQTANSRPLIENHEIIVLPSVTALAVIREGLQNRVAPPKQVVVLGDPVFDEADGRVRGKLKRPAGSRSEFPRLFSSRWEGEQIVSLVPRGEGKLVVDFAANQAFASSPEVSGYRIVHFATHAIIDLKHPAASGIVLSMVDQHGKPQDGFLSLDEIFKLKLPVDLVVLSACRTALGKDYAGEGLVGLTRGFMNAGASRVVVSLWQVPDKATSELMVRFYKQMLGPKKLSPSAALRAAQLELRKDPRWHSSYYWAPFILQGEWR